MGWLSGLNGIVPPAPRGMKSVTVQLEKNLPPLRNFNGIVCMGNITSQFKPNVVSGAISGFLPSSEVLDSIDIGTYFLNMLNTLSQKMSRI